MLECVGHGDKDRSFIPKQGSKINYYALVQGGLPEVRHVFARVVFDTVYPPNLENQNCESPG